MGDGRGRGGRGHGKIRSSSIIFEVFRVRRQEEWNENETECRPPQLLRVSLYGRLPAKQRGLEKGSQKIH